MSDSKKKFEEMNKDCNSKLSLEYNPSAHTNPFNKVNESYPQGGEHGKKVRSVSLDPHLIWALENGVMTLEQVLEHVSFTSSGGKNGKDHSDLRTIAKEKRYLEAYTPKIFTNESTHPIGTPAVDEKPRAKRYNKGKTRHVLIPSFAKEALADVYTRGAHKYSMYKDKDGNLVQGKDFPFENVGDYELVEDAKDNWRLGQTWLECMDSAMRHIEAWKRGEDLDPELGTYHLANAAWGMFSLLEFYKIFPEGDNRPHAYLSNKKIGLDIDEVLCDWVGDWTSMRGAEIPTSWYFDRELLDRFESMKKEGTLDKFYAELKPLIDPSEIPFEPHCYITSRPVDTKVTEAWLAKHGFPARPVFTTTKERTKVVIAKEQGLDIFIDDSFDNFRNLNNAGICTFLMDAPHNRRYDVGYRRIKKIKDIM